MTQANALCRPMPDLLFVGLLMVCITITPVRAQIQLTETALELEYSSLDEMGQFEVKERIWKADTGSMLVPEHRENPDTRRVRIPIHRIRALGEPPGVPIFWLSGGPGQSNMHSFSYDYFISEHDHVMVGYRGVDGEVSLDCPEVIEAMEEGGDILGDAMRQAVASAYSSCASRLIAQGVDLNGYTAVEVARDIDDARIALGYDSIILIGESYGTRVAYYYSQLFPEHLDKMILIGSNPPGRMVWNPYTNDRLIRHYARLWSSDAEAVEMYPDLVEAIRMVESDFPDSWLLMPIYEGTVRGSMNAFLFHTETAAQGFDAYVAAAKGDPSGLWLFSVVGSMIWPTSVNWGDNASKAVSADYRAGIEYVNMLDPDDALFGAPMGAFLWSSVRDGKWPIEPLPERFRSVEQTDVPTLFISGSLDLSTPPENVELDLLPKFPNGHHVVISEAGHILDLWRSQPAATRNLLHSYIRSGVPDTSGFVYKPVSFSVAWGFPILAKISIGVGVIVICLIGAALFLVVRKYMRIRGQRPANA